VRGAWGVRLLRAGELGASAWCVRLLRAGERIARTRAGESRTRAGESRKVRTCRVSRRRSGGAGPARNWKIENSEFSFFLCYDSVCTT
jgi:hypothetical protein